MTTHFSGIKGLEGRTPIGAVLRIGRKNPGRGFPIERDRFYIVSPKQDGSGSRPMHPAFKLWNDRALKDAALAKTIECELASATVSGCYNAQLMAYRLGKNEHDAPPDRQPACTGDGVNAKRWMGNDWHEIPCPNDKCQYRQRKPPDCKPDVRLIFHPVWPDGVPMPSMLMTLESKSWNTAANIKGMFDHILEQAAWLGIDNPFLFKFPFRLTLEERTKPSEKSKFPVVTATPTCDVQDFLSRSAEIRKQIEAGKVELPNMQDREHWSGKEAESRHRELSSVPAMEG